MSYLAIIARAYRLVIDHPFLWLLGLFMTAGFNVNWLYILALNRSNTVLKVIDGSTTALRTAPLNYILLGGVIGMIILIVAAAAKIKFWQFAHGIIHGRT